MMLLLRRTIDITEISVTILSKFVWTLNVIIKKYNKFVFLEACAETNAFIIILR